MKPNGKSRHSPAPAPARPMEGIALRSRLEIRPSLLQQRPLPLISGPLAAFLFIVTLFVMAASATTPEPHWIRLYDADKMAPEGDNIGDVPNVLEYIPDKTATPTTARTQPIGSRRMALPRLCCLTAFTSQTVLRSIQGRCTMRNGLSVGCGPRPWAGISIRIK
jgi:hypothetical protein